MLRIGFGYDAHRLVAGRDLVLGGEKIPHELGLLGHSDADVLSHSIGDALLGALNLGDLGKHFPDTEEIYRNISSLRLLCLITDMLKKRNAKIVNIDSTIVAEKPRLANFIEKMKENLAECLEIEREQISIKATTTEGMGFAGKGEGISAYAVVLVEVKT